jgi:nitrite reductase/ring-hydroxylating ferredoxin subunit
MHKPSRRDFLKLAADGLLTLSGLLGLGGLVRYLSFELDPAPPTEFDLGPAINYPLHSRSLLLHIPAVLLHEDDGYMALSLICTHLGCTVEQKENSYECPCHGSIYNGKGEVQKGPAKNALKRLRVTTTEVGNLVMHLD